ncbi:hypothetical protein G6O69_37520 [Pseudenhygromyxa sp. WMMC2535]|uniref:hypothetical protein n=1 Tax=Pseudenhygromyxa sp. WMMC2535 TaxID=2712867 RepID=UPI0015529C5E|nr:hypothetical protein [Pseudenhygromyxa sp. WMMC2535]NVB38192.1 hypothetical protein [Pseudenhygromyxa sp. WMMC2535]NVB43573.1 hypothetical protein [Pseudenhygromyxa sp. WMMC2535]
MNAPLSLLPAPFSANLSSSAVDVLVDALGDAYGLNRRERSVAHLLMLGSVRGIASQLGLVVGLIDAQAREVYAKTGAANRRELVRRAVRMAAARDLADAPVAGPRLRTIAPAANGGPTPFAA